MSRSGYSDDGGDGWAGICWRGAVASAIRGKRGQTFLRELAATLDAMPVKELIGSAFGADGGVCALGSVCVNRGITLPVQTDEDWQFDARGFARTSLGITDALAAEIMYENDEGIYCNETNEHRWKRMRAWVSERIAKERP